MRNREASLRKVDQIDSSLKKVISYLRRGDEQNFNDTLEDMNEQIDQLRTYIDSEPIVGDELNTSSL